MMIDLPVQQPYRGPVYAPIRSLMLFVTEDCNLRCTYCFVKKAPRKMTSETARKAVDFFTSQAISGSEREIHINFFGGEPFTELERIEEVVEYCRRPRGGLANKRITYSATTNATIATPRVERLLKDTKMHLLVSLDGTSEANRLRPFVSGRSSYEVVARNLPKLVRWAGLVVVRMTFTPDTLNLVENVRHALELGAPGVGLCPVQECDWASCQPELETAYDELADWFLSELRRGEIPPLDVTWGLIWQLDRVRRFGAGRPARPCPVAHSLIGVDPDGNVMPCHRFLYRPQDWLGTVDSAELSEERWKYVHLKSSDLVDCESCPAKMVCGGGCRVVALNARRGLEGVHEDYCITMRAHARVVERIYDTMMAEQNPLFLKVLSTRKILKGALAELVGVG